MNTKDITFVIKPVSTKCNLECKYCYYSTIRKQAYVRISENLLSSILRNISSLKQIHSRFIWHGGEPTLAGLEFYKQVIAFQKEFFPSGYQLINSIQSNGVLINRNWARFLKANKFRVGISLDGPRSIHDANRQFPNGKGTFDCVMNAIEILRDEGISVGVVSVISKQSLPHVQEIFDFLYTQGINRLNFSPLVDFDSKGILKDYAITPIEWGQFLIKIFDLWIKKDDPQVKIQLIESLLQGLIGGKPTLCVCKKDCSNFISIDYEGTLYFCGRFLGNSQFKLGKIPEQTIEEILDGDPLDRISSEIRDLSSQCKSCKWLHICNGGCPDHRYILSKDISGISYFCHATKMILDHMEATIKKFPLIPANFSQTEN